MMAGCGRRMAGTLIILPPSAQALVELHELFALSDLRDRVLLLQIVELTLGVDDIEKIGQAAVVSFGRQIDGPWPATIAALNFSKRSCCACIGIERRIHLLHGVQDGLFR